LAVEDLVEAADRVLELDVLARRAGELLGDEVRLREVPLDPARARDDELVLVRELVDTENRDDVLQVAVALEDLLYPRRRAVVVDEEQHVLALIAEVLGHRQAGEADAQPGARRLVHLSVDERDLVEHARLRHLEDQVVALARALPHAGEDGYAAVLARDVVDQ